MNNVDLGRYKQRFVQYFWDPEPKNDDTSTLPIWCLGRVYTPAPQLEQEGAPEKDSLKSGSPSESTVSHSSVESKPSTEATSTGDDYQIIQDVPSSESSDGGWPSIFLDDFESRIWMTYRSNFSSIPKSKEPNAASSMTFSVRLRSQLMESGGFTSDTGWGCMIRSGQSLLANTLSALHLGRDWRRTADFQDEAKLLSLFADDPLAPFSIHRFVRYGASACGKHPGEWFGPSATARCIQALSREYREAGLSVYITNDDSEVYEDKFLETATSRTGEIGPTLILLGIRLGIDRVTPVYWEALKDCFRFSQSVGIAGGRPSASHYFVGVQDSHFFYLDPHQTRPAVPYHANADEYTKEEIDSFHIRRLRRLHISEMDPSMLLGFLIRDENDWNDWKAALEKVQGKSIIHVSDRAPPLHGHGPERAGAVDEVESFDEDNGDEEDYVVSSPP